MHVDRGWLEEGITLGQFISKECVKVPQLQTKAQSDEPMHPGDKVHRTVRLHE